MDWEKITHLTDLSRDLDSSKVDLRAKARGEGVTYLGITVGDTVFNAQGRPGVVKDKKPDGSLTVEQKGEGFETSRRQGFINGLAPEDRVQFKQILADIKKAGDPEKKLSMLYGKIEDLKKDPKNFILARYIESEAAHIVNTVGITPKEYNIAGELTRNT